MKNNNFNREILKYFLIFSILILAFLWIFQVLFMNKYYRYKKAKDIISVANTVVKNQNSQNFDVSINRAAYDKEACVEIIDNHFNVIYSSYSYEKSCFLNKNVTMNYMYDFITSGMAKKTYELINPNTNSNTFVYAIELDNNKYAFVNTALEPIGSTVNILQEQLIIVSFVVLVLSFIGAYFISKHIAAPIVKINEQAKKLAKGDFKTPFTSETDITEIKELANTLNYTRNELGKTDELRRDLMANVSHDLKTPLTMIKAYAESSRDLHVNNKAKRTDDLNIIISETDRLAVLVNDILTLSKVQSNIDSLIIEEFDLINLVNDILNRYKVLIETENYQLNFIHEKEKVLVKADKRKLEQVIYNLINNAINYTGDDKKVTIRISNEDDGILVEIIDTGCGINSDELPYIWDKYYKNSKTHKRDVVGTGLGLSIVKSILELHKYQYGVKSLKGKGSNFYFIIKD